jgi:hypothetical protein
MTLARSWPFTLRGKEGEGLVPPRDAAGLTPAPADGLRCGGRCRAPAAAGSWRPPGCGRRRGGQRHVLHLGELVLGLERFGMEHVEPGMADAPAPSGGPTPVIGRFGGQRWATIGLYKNLDDDGACSNVVASSRPRIADGITALACLRDSGRSVAAASASRPETSNNGE